MAEGTNRRSSGGNLSRLFLLCALFLILTLAAQIVIGYWNSRLMQQNTTRFSDYAAMVSANHQSSMELLEERQLDLKKRLETGEITTEEWTALTTESQMKWQDELAVGQPTPPPTISPPQWLQVFAVIGTLGTGALVLAFWVALWFFGLRSLNELRRKGYKELSLADGMWLSLRLGRGVRRLPNADDFLTLPGATESAASLIQFARHQLSDKKS